MAKIRQGIMGPFSGKIGPIIGSSWKDIFYIKSAPVDNGQQRIFTPAQLANQQRFKLMNDFLDPFQPFITIGFANLATNRTELNAAFMVNFKEAMELVADAYHIRYDRFCLSKGNLPGLETIVVQRMEPTKLLINWDANIVFAAANDQVMLVVYCPALKIVDGFVGFAQRSSGAVQFEMSKKMENYAIEIYLSMVSLNRKKISNSQYLGRKEP